MSEGLRVEDEEPVGAWVRSGRIAYPAATVRAAADRAGVSADVVVAAKNAQGRAAGWSAPGILGWVFGELLKREPGRPLRDPDLIALTYRGWARRLSGLPPDGPAVRDLIRLWLWSTPPPDFADDLAAAVEADRGYREAAGHRRAAEAEARDILGQLRLAYKDDPSKAPELIRDLVTPPARRRRRPVGAGPKWRRGDFTKTRKHLERERYWSWYDDFFNH